MSGDTIFSLNNRPKEVWDYPIGCPVGEWTGRLDYRVWGNAANLMLHFTDIDSGEKWCLSVWHPDGYKPRGGGPNFKTEATEGELYRIASKHTKTGNPNFVSAARIAPAP